MKKILVLSCSLLCLAAFHGCDKVEFPLENTSGSSGPTWLGRKVMLEDYTGSSCGTCPPAGEKAATLEAQYGDHLVIFAVHAGFLAIPSGPPLDYDFRNQVSTDYYNTFGIVSNPTGLINRAGFPNTTHLTGYTAWSSKISNIINTPPSANVKITNTYDTVTRQLSVSVLAKFLTATAGLHKLVVLLVEDSIFKPQKDDRLQSPAIDMNYYHRHVLRAAINGGNSAWGDTLAVGLINAGDSLTKSYTYTIPTVYNAGWNVNDRKCYVIAFIYDAETNSTHHYEVLQVEEEKVR